MPRRSQWNGGIAAGDMWMIDEDSIACFGGRVIRHTALKRRNIYLLVIVLEQL